MWSLVQFFVLRTLGYVSDIETREKIIKTYFVRSVLLYGCGSWKNEKGPFANNENVDLEKNELDVMG